MLYLAYAHTIFVGSDWYTHTASLSMCVACTGTVEQGLGVLQLLIFACGYHKMESQREETKQQ